MKTKDNHIPISPLSSVKQANRQEGGLRIQGKLKENSGDKPLITVITVVYNDEHHLEETILSVVNQTYEYVEYIIIDGGSTDGTLDIIKKYEHVIDYWISEPDKGIYDAMNKGAQLASDGSLLIWINADDCLLTLDNFLKHYAKHVDAYFFSVLQKDKGQQNGRIWQIRKGKITVKNILPSHVHHQGFIVKKSAFHDYNLEIGLSADYLLMAQIINNDKLKKRFVVNECLSTYSLGGISDKVSVDKLRSYILVARALQMRVGLFILYNWFPLFKFTGKVMFPYKFTIFIRSILVKFRKPYKHK